MVLFLLFTIFGQIPDYNLNESSMKAVPAEAGNPKHYALTVPQQAPSAVGYEATDSVSYEGVGYDRDQVQFTFSEELGESALPVDRKIIKEGSAYIETKDFDHSIAIIDQMIGQSGGFTERKSIRGNSYNASDLRYATIVFRVPSQQFEAIMENMGTIGLVINSNSNGTDITDQYIDSETRLRNLKVQEETLLDILSRAEKLEDVITLEARISEVRYEIETIKNQLKNYDRLVQYSRISIDLAEVVETTKKTPVARTLGDRVATAFSASIDSFVDHFENFMVWLVYNWILLAVILVLFIDFIIVLRHRKKRKKNVISVTVETQHDKDNSQDSESNQ